MAHRVCGEQSSFITPDSLRSLLIPLNTHRWIFSFCSIFLIMTSPKQVTREGLAGALKGITITIPDLEAMVAHWPRAVNVHREELRLDVNRRMER